MRMCPAHVAKSHFTDIAVSGRFPYSYAYRATQTAMKKPPAMQGYRNADKNPVYMMHQRYSNFGWLSCTENVLIAQRDKKLRNRNDAIKVLAAVGLWTVSYSVPTLPRHTPTL